MQQRHTRAKDAQKVTNEEAEQQREPEVEDYIADRDARVEEIYKAGMKRVRALLEVKEHENGKEKMKKGGLQKRELLKRMSG